MALRSIMREKSINSELNPLYEDTVTQGQRLADKPLSEGGWKEFFKDTSDIEEVCKQPGYTHKVEEVVAMTAILLENEHRNLRAMSEDVRAIQVGGFQDMIFPIIRAAFPVNPILDMVSVQPLTRRHGQVFFMNYVIGQTKGAYTAGQRIFDALAGYAGGYHYSDEFVEGEVAASPDGSTAAFSGTLTYGASGGGGVRPGTLMFRCVDSDGASTVEVRDNGNGILFRTVGNTLTVSSGTINYATGAWALTFSGNPAAGSLLAYYEYDSEGSSNLPTIDVQMETSPITAKRRALRYRYSLEASQDFAAEFGRDLDPEIAQSIAATLVTEQAREVLSDLWTAAGVPFQSFDITHTPSTAGYSKREHFGDLQWPLAQTINQMYEETQRVNANWMVVDTAMANVLAALGAPYFFQWERAAVDNDTLGVKFLGTWNGTVRVYLDSLLNRFPGASRSGNALLGYKGTDFGNVSYIWAPYRMMYMTPATTLDDMVTRKAVASRVGRKLVNSRMVKRFELIGA